MTTQEGQYELSTIGVGNNPWHLPSLAVVTVIVAVILVAAIHMFKPRDHS